MRSSIEKSILLCLILLLSGCTYSLNLTKISEGRWLEIESPHFYVVTDSDWSAAQKLVRDLEEFRYFITVILKRDVLEGVPPVKILAVSRRSNFKNLGIPKIWDGLFSQNLNGSYAIANVYNYETDSAESNNAKSTLMHEYVHYAMVNTFDKEFHPLWYQEGVAEYLSTFRREGNRITIGELDVLKDRLIYLRRIGGRYAKIGIEDLLKIRSLKDVGSIRRFYAEAMMAVHYFKSSGENQRGLDEYLKLINAGYGVDAAFAEAFGRSFDEVDLEIQRYLNGSRKAIEYRLGVGGFWFPKFDMTRRELASASLHYHIADFLTRFSFTPGTEKERILREGVQKNPQNLHLQIMLADHYLYRQPGKSEEILAKVLAQAPDHHVALTVYGDLIYDRARLRRAVGMDGWEAMLDDARSQYRRAIGINRYYARPYAGVGNVYLGKTDNDLLKEGAVSFDTARFFVGQGDLAEFYLYEALLRIRMRDYKNAITTFRGYMGLSSGSFESTTGLGLYVYEALAYRELPELSRKNGNQYVYADGSVYTGGWRNGKPHGQGQLTRPGGALFKGAWTDGVLHGKGEFISSTGFHYTGDFYNGEITGKGVLLYPDEHEVMKSQGEFFAGLGHGKQEFVFDSGERRVGTYWMGYANGPERRYKSDGSVVNYERVFGNHKLELEGGVVYAGGLDEEGKAHGAGVCYREKDGQPYRCAYKHGAEVKSPRKH